MDINLIREAYPNPMVAPDNDTGDPACYCVGGALAMFYDIHWLEYKHKRFPNAEDLGEVLSYVNPHLTQHTALLYARLITRANDNHSFWFAWNMAEEAIDYTPEPQHIDINE